MLAASSGFVTAALSVVGHLAVGTALVAARCYYEPTILTLENKERRAKCRNITTESTMFLPTAILCMLVWELVLPAWGLYRGVRAVMRAARQAGERRLALHQHAALILATTPTAESAERELDETITEVRRFLATDPAANELARAIDALAPAPSAHAPDRLVKELQDQKRTAQELRELPRSAAPVYGLCVGQYAISQHTLNSHHQRVIDILRGSSDE